VTLAFCLGFRDWHLDHLERCLQSIRAHSSADIAVADLGSELAMRRALRKLCLRSTIGANLIEVARPEWSRSVALNVAAQHVGTPDWLVFTDADMLFPASWFKTVHDWVGGALWLTRSRDLGESDTTIGLRVNALFSHKRSESDAWLYAHSTPHGNDLGQGAAMVVPRPWFTQVGGFDEFYQVWGCEDNDLTARAQWDGLQVRWLPDAEHQAWVVHQWHRRDWPTPLQFEQVQRNRMYFSQRLAAQGPVVRNRRP
jgi:hypothetical protein